MVLPDPHIIDRLTPVYGRREAVAIACWIQEEDEASYDLETVLNRLEKREPLQYVFGHTDWRGLRLALSSATLIPRPETAELADLVCAQKAERTLTVLDIGTGSGCIAIAIKKTHPEWEVFACDISAEALKIAEQNARDNGVEVHFFQADILAENPLSRTFDIIVSNPPYICEEEKATMDENVLAYEPASALFVPNDDPLLFYRAIARLRACEHLFFEINERFGRETADMLKEENYYNIQIINDICGKERIVSASR